MDYQRTDPIIHMHVEMEWVLPGAYEPLKALKERATTGAIKIQIQAQYFPTYYGSAHLLELAIAIYIRLVPHLNLYFDGTQVNAPSLHMHV